MRHTAALSSQERNVFLELDRLRVNLESLTDQLAQVARSSQDAAQQHDNKALQLGLLAAEIDKVKTELADMSRVQKSVVEGLEQLIARQLKMLRQSVNQSVEEQLKAHTASLQEQLTGVRAECSAACSSSEASALQVNSLAIKLRAQLQAAEQAQQGVNQQLEEFRTRHEGVASSIGMLEHDGKKVKRHVVKMQKQIEGLQAMGHVAIAADKTAKQTKQECDEANAAVAAASTSSAAALSAVKALARRVQAQEDARQEGVASLRQEVTLLAESIGSCLTQLCESSRRQAASAPPSYLQTLLADRGPALGLSGGSQQAQQQADAWDAARHDFDKYLHGHRMRGVAAGGGGQRR